MSETLEKKINYSEFCHRIRKSLGIQNNCELLTAINSRDPKKGVPITKVKEELMSLCNEQNANQIKNIGGVNTHYKLFLMELRNLAEVEKKELDGIRSEKNRIKHEECFEFQAKMACESGNISDIEQYENILSGLNLEKHNSGLYELFRDTRAWATILANVKYRLSEVPVDEKKQFEQTQKFFLYQSVLVFIDKNLDQIKNQDLDTTNICYFLDFISLFGVGKFIYLYLNIRYNSGYDHYEILTKKSFDLVGKKTLNKQQGFRLNNRSNVNILFSRLKKLYKDDINSLIVDFEQMSKDPFCFIALELNDLVDVVPEDLLISCCDYLKPITEREKLTTAYIETQNARESQGKFTAKLCNVIKNCDDIELVEAVGTELLVDNPSNSDFLRQFFGDVLFQDFAHINIDSISRIVDSTYLRIGFLERQVRNSKSIRVNTVKIENSEVISPTQPDYKVELNFGSCFELSSSFEKQIEHYWKHGDQTNKNKLKSITHNINNAYQQFLIETDAKDFFNFLRRESKPSTAKYSFFPGENPYFNEKESWIKAECIEFYVSNAKRIFVVRSGPSKISFYGENEQFDGIHTKRNRNF
jgi:hypothetical protein